MSRFAKENTLADMRNKVCRASRKSRKAAPQAARQYTIIGMQRMYPHVGRRWSAIRKEQVIKLPPFGRAGAGLQLTVFCNGKDRLLHAKRPPFAMRKTAYRQAADSQRLTEAAQTVMKELSRRHARTAETKRKGRADDMSARPLRRRKWSHRESNSNIIFKKLATSLFSYCRE